MVTGLGESQGMEDLRERDAYGDGGPEGEISSSKKGKLLERKGCV